MTDSERRMAHILDLLYDADDEFPYIYKLLGSDYDPREYRMWFDILRELKYRDLIDLPPGLGEGITPRITARGRQEVEARRAQEADPANRKRAARIAILLYLSEQPDHEALDIGRLLVSRYATVDGIRLTMDDIKQALKYLKRKGLVNGIESGSDDELARPQLTDDGIECVEDYNASIDDYLHRGSRAPGPVTIAAGPGSNVAVANGGSAQAGNTTVTRETGERPDAEAGKARRARTIQTWATVLGVLVALVGVFLSR